MSRKLKFCSRKFLKLQKKILEVEETLDCCFKMKALKAILEITKKVRIQN